MSHKLNTKHYKLIITIDGPAASGKGTLAKLVAREYSLLSIDSGACYRGLAWLAKKHAVPVDSEHVHELQQLLEENPIEINDSIEDGEHNYIVSVNGKAISHEIRTTEIGEMASVLGTFEIIRNEICELQRRIATNSKHGVVVDGRDAGTVVFPDAEIKFFLTASLEERVERRYAEYVADGKQVSREEVYTDVVRRDQRDSSGAYAALRMPVDAIVVDSTGYKVEQTFAEVKGHIEKKLKA